MARPVVAATLFAILWLAFLLISRGQICEAAVCPQYDGRCPGSDDACDSKCKADFKNIRYGICEASGSRASKRIDCYCYYDC